LVLREIEPCRIVRDPRRRSSLARPYDSDGR
jgi:hypothetical protein